MFWQEVALEPFLQDCQEVFEIDDAVAVEVGGDALHAAFPAVASAGLFRASVGADIDDVAIAL